MSEEEAQKAWEHYVYEGKVDFSDMEVIDSDTYITEEDGCEAKEN